MTDFKQKTVGSFEWKLIVPARCFRKLQTFTFQDQMCKFEYSCTSAGNYDGHAELLFKSEKLLNRPAYFIVVLKRGANKTTSMEFVKGLRKTIWKSDSGCLPGLWTFEILILPDVSEENISGNQDHFSSDLGKHFQALSRDFSKLLEDPSSCDATITCDGKAYHVHKIVLNARSNVLSSMVKENADSVVVKGIKGSVFERFLLYLYSGTLPQLSVNTAMEFYKAGSQYAVDQLKHACLEFLTENLSEDNACAILVFADRQSDVGLRKKVISYIVEKQIPGQDPNWPQFCKQHCHLANKVMNVYVEKQSKNN